MIYAKTLAAAAIALGAVSGSAFAQVNANNLVNVNISNVANDIAENLDVDVDDVIAIGAVQVPIGVAATVCNVQANVLAAKNKSEAAACDATSSSQALAQVVGKQMKAQ